MPRMNVTSNQSTAQRQQNTAKSLCPLSSNTGAKSSLTVSGGVDYLEVSGWCHWSRETHDDLIDKLESLKVEAIANRDAKNGGMALLEMDSGQVIEVLPNAIGKGVVCRYALRIAGGVRIGITTSREAAESKPNVRVMIPSDPLMVMGHVAAWGAVESVIGELGGQIHRTNVSRIDLCADMVGKHVSEYVKLYLADQYIANARTTTIHKDGRNYSGFTIGKAIKLRVYDKLLESKDKPDKLDILVQRRWGQMPDKATRVEFQIRGKQIRERITADTTVEGVFSAIPKMIEWLTDRWFRLTDRVVDHGNNNHQRAKHHDLWNETISAFQEWAGRNQSDLLAPIKRTNENTKRLFQQAIGCIAKAQAMMVERGLDSVGFLANAVRSLEEYADYGAECLERKRREVEIGTAIGPPVDLQSVPF